MAFVWSDAIDGIDRDELAALYLVAPLARKKPADLHQAFANGRFPRFAFEDGKLVAAGGVLADGVDVACATSPCCPATREQDWSGRSWPTC